MLLVPGVSSGFEDDSRLMCNLRAPYPPQQFLCFSRKHGSADHFNASFTETGVLEGRVFFVRDHGLFGDLMLEINSVATLQTQVVESILKRTHT